MSPSSSSVMSSSCECAASAAASMAGLLLRRSVAERRMLASADLCCSRTDVRLRADDSRTASGGVLPLCCSACESSAAHGMSTCRGHLQDWCVRRCVYF